MIKSVYICIVVSVVDVKCPLPFTPTPTYLSCFLRHLKLLMLFTHSVNCEFQMFYIRVYNSLSLALNLRIFIQYLHISILKLNAGWFNAYIKPEICVCVCVCNLKSFLMWYCVWRMACGDASIAIHAHTFIGNKMYLNCGVFFEKKKKSYRCIYFDCCSSWPIEGENI